LDYLVFVFMPFLTVAVFVLGMGFRIVNWGRTPSPGKMTLFPAPKKGSGTFWGVVKESFFFTGIFRSNKSFWLFTWIFHVSLALIIVGHVRVFTDFPALWEALNINADQMSAVFGGAAGIVILFFSLMLILRRVSLQRVREISGFADYFALFLILAILVTGNLMRFGEHFDLELTRTYFSQLFTFSLATASIPQNPMFRLHLLLVQLLIIYIPFSKIMHFGGIFFSQSLIQRS
jgi:[DsrC]-trisulfide reductase subunit M